MNVFRKKSNVIIEEPRAITVNTKHPNFPNNEIITSQYTLLSFLPKNLYGQFRRFANFYFLIVLIIHLNINSPISPLTSAVPLIVMVIVTAIKQGYEDVLRHAQDKKINMEDVTILQDSQLISIPRKDISVGDIVEIIIDEEIPCDLVLLSSSDKDNTCNIITANLDGESHLKTFECCSFTSNLQTEIHLDNLKATIHCETPQSNLYTFKGKIEIEDPHMESVSTSLDTKNLLLRGSKLKNTQRIYGCAVYTGEDTKMALNSKILNGKFSTIERRLNYFILFYLVVLILEVILNTLLKYIYFYNPTIENMWYLGNVVLTASFDEIAQDSFSNFILICYLIPISLYVTMEIQKFMCSYFFGWDEKMKCDKTGEPAVSNTSDLNEELGQVEYLFTDKTGTLTENLMTFRECSILGNEYKEINGKLKYKNGTEYVHFKNLEFERKNNVLNFFTCLSLCHTIEVKEIPIQFTRDSIRANLRGRNLINPPDFKTKRTYIGPSPDEQALVEASKKFGIKLLENKENIIKIKVFEEIQEFSVLHILEFDSDRKIMSVIVRNSMEQIILICKGAESSILPKCFTRTDDQKMLLSKTERHLHQYASAGLRTLAVAKKELTLEEFELFNKNILSAKQDMGDRIGKVAEVYEMMESNLELIGATGVEDVLQDGVKPTLTALKEAGIKIWILTGDKVETAVNISFSTNIFQPGMKIHYLTQIDNDNKALELLEKYSSIIEKNTNYGLVLDGISLPYLISNSEIFQSFGKKYSSVVCCRLSPSQKAQVVKLVKNGPDTPLCAAIGDGANDVSMIQEANLGIGIIGKEGRQAVLNADFGLGRFRFLKRALLVHGHWYYNRLAVLVQYSFYKNVAFITPQVFFSFYCAFSTQSLFDGTYLTFFNLLFAALPIIIYGVLEQNINEETLLENPVLYKNISRNKLLSWKWFFLWGALGLWHSIVLFFGLLLSFSKEVLNSNGKAYDLSTFGLACVAICVFVINIKLLLVSNHYTLPFIGSIVISLLGFVAYSLLYTGFVMPFISNTSIYWTYYDIWGSANIILSSAILFVICLIPDVLIAIHTQYKNQYNQKFKRRRRSKTKVKNESTCL